MIDPDFLNKAKEQIKAIDADIAKLQELKQALLTIVSSAPEQTPATTERKHSYSVAPLQPSAHSAHTTKMSLPAAVRFAVRQFKGEEFTAAKIEQLLIELNKLPDVSQPRAQIATALKNMKKKGEIEQTYTPIAGNEPYRFRATNRGLFG